MYGLFADIVMLLHFGFILLVIFGGILALRWHRLALVHLPAVVWALFLECRPGTVCPLTPLEQALRLRAGQSSYAGGFIHHYLGQIIYHTMTPKDQYIVGGTLFVFTIAIYCIVYRRWQSRRQ
jgi:hypothetical protein